jgi:hypothetical protein
MSSERSRTARPRSSAPPVAAVDAAAPVAFEHARVTPPPTEPPEDAAGPPPAPRTRRQTAVATLLGVAIALASTGRLVFVSYEAIPAPTECMRDLCADNALSLWLMTTAGRRLYRNPATLFDAPVFHPLRHALAYSESMLSAAVVMRPLEWLLASPIAAYDWLYLAAIALAVVGMFLLVREATGDARAGLVAGTLFGLTSERTFWWGFPPALAVHWAPFVLWTWLRFLARPGVGRGVALGAALLAHMHASAYHGLMLPALLVPWALVLAVGGPWPLARWWRSALPLAVAGAIGVALYLPYEVVHEELQYEPQAIAFALGFQYWEGLLHPIEYAASRVGEPIGYLAASPIGLWLLAIALVVALVRPRRTPGSHGMPAHVVAALVLLGLAMAVSMGAVLWTPFGLAWGPLAALRLLPGFAAMRAVVRFMMLAAFARALVGGLAMAILLARVSPATARVLTLVVLVLATVDARLGDPRPVYDLTVPPAWRRGYEWLAATPPDTAVLELPYGSFGSDAQYMVYALSHGRRLMNGYAAALPRFTDVVSRLPDDVALRALDDAGVRYVLVHPSRLAGPFTASFLARLQARRDLQVAALDDTLVLAVPRMPARESPGGTPLARDGWRIEGSAPDAVRAADGDLTTHWRATSAREDAWLRVDLGREVHVTGVAVELGMHVLEYPRRYQVRASRDGVVWETLGEEMPTIPPFASYRRDHRHIALTLNVRPGVARWIELRVPKYPAGPLVYGNGAWAVHELVVLADAAGEGARSP